jgi:hypothetical protein
MASPHAAGVAALAVGRWGARDWRQGGKFLPPRAVELLLRGTATDKACPTPPAFTYTPDPAHGRDRDRDARLRRHAEQ